MVLGDSLQIGILKGLIKLPPDIKTPVICVGPGTGVAPMRSVLQERLLSGSCCMRPSSSSGGSNLTKVSPANTLYFGCRSANKDQHYSFEWEDLSRTQKLAYRVACSRDGPGDVKRTYVQDLMREDAESVWELIGKRGAQVYISG